MLLSDKNLMLHTVLISMQSFWQKTLCYLYFTISMHLSDKKPYVTSISALIIGKNLMLQVFHINHLAKTLCYKYFSINHLTKTICYKYFTLIIWQKTLCYKYFSINGMLLSDKKPYVTYSISH